MSESVKYRKIATELDEIFKYLDVSILYKIPENLRENIKKIKLKNYNFKYDINKSLKEQKLLKQTRDAFSYIYLKYCCDEQTRERLIQKCKENDIKNQEKYNYENLFKNNIINSEVKVEKISSNDVPIVVEEKQSLFKQIINKISLFIKNITKK